MIIFDRVTLNDGQGYNPLTGVFKAQAFGVYMFTVNVCSAGGRYLVASLKAGTWSLGIFSAQSSKYPSCFSRSITVRLPYNVDITLQISKGWFYFTREYAPSFSGYLLYPLSPLQGEH